jgi:hypothetical protein
MRDLAPLFADGPEADARNASMAAHAARSTFSPQSAAWAADIDGGDQLPPVPAPATAS